MLLCEYKEEENKGTEATRGTTVSINIATIVGQLKYFESGFWSKRRQVTFVKRQADLIGRMLDNAEPKPEGVTVLDLNAALGTYEQSPTAESWSAVRDQVVSLREKLEQPAPEPEREPEPVQVTEGRPGRSRKSKRSKTEAEQPEAVEV